jgi:hypothetical protein
VKIAGTAWSQTIDFGVNANTEQSGTITFEGTKVSVATKCAGDLSYSGVYSAEGTTLHLYNTSDPTNVIEQVLERQ